jgi:plasmid stability protein
MKECCSNARSDRLVLSGSGRGNVTHWTYPGSFDFSWQSTLSVKLAFDTRATILRLSLIALTEGTVSQLLVRDLDQDLVEALKRRAASRGRSAEAEHREILRATLLGQPVKRPLKELLAEMPYFEDDELFDLR